MKSLKFVLATALIGPFLVGCGSARVSGISMEKITQPHYKTTPLTKKQEHHWAHLDLLTDTIPGMSVDRAYGEILKTKQGNTTLVAVIDSGMDIDHEDLSAVIWTNPNEIPNNGIDDDNNGYVDDIHGWNFLGDAYNEQFEYTRILAKGDTSHPQYTEAEQQYQKEFKKYSEYKNIYDRVTAQVVMVDYILSTHLKKSTYSKADIDTISTNNPSVLNAIEFMKIYTADYDSISEFKEAVEKDMILINDHLNYHLNKDFHGRTTGDNPDDLSDVGYGDNNVKPHDPEETHGTHVAGIIAAQRNNHIGVDGVANNVKLMAIRSTPNGDEYDKDVALAIRYAVDNGAKIINGSFGKYYATHSEWVSDAIRYAAQHDVLLVISAGNDAYNLDDTPSYPNDMVNGKEISDNFLVVGALTPTYGTKVVADYSNYGQHNVDVFAPGSDIYSTYPNNTYKSENGTSMAAPAVTGVAAIIRSQYPHLSASEVKNIIMKSGVSLPTEVQVGDDPTHIKAFQKLSKSGKIVNAYNALLMASKIK
ncbi:S8 family peptidase [Mangrovimonas sp. YM274]|uniref:S8 family peptidase n=1 Tax=Mangrovimonas sp. YM274 TaxID=3070660 RepID=UPI0027DCBEAB|nr:S8 family peptidase [Mangrovimonas sp. YM274]WMI68975.1 S8 family peptidase [Mangrovimonas sp. YM274]